jgi:nickel/cobalt transporter (NicO) family protein
LQAARCAKMSFRRFGWLAAGVATFLVGGLAFAHPVPRGEHDRTIAVHIRPSPRGDEVLVRVDYRLEVDKLTVVLDDMAPFADQVPKDKARESPKAYFDEFTRIYAPILAANLIATADGKPLSFVCARRSCRDTDDQGLALGHLRCDFVFEASLPLKEAVEHAVTVRESNYLLQAGKILLSTDFGQADRMPFPFAGSGLFTDGSVFWGAEILRLKVPDAVLQAKPARELAPGDDAKLREFAVQFRLVTAATDAAGTPGPTTPTPDSVAPEMGSGDSDLLELFLSSGQGLATVLLLSALVGAAHALTPGHGKTLVAAYLVGQRGTTVHALILGLVTTVTHTGVVLAIALGLMFVDENARRQVANSLGLIMGLALVCLGAWLLLQRLAGRADHFHLGGGHHHHDHKPRAEVQQRVGWWGLVVLGMTGGIAPCWDAVAMLVLAIGMNLFWMALPMLLAFSAGLASVLVLIGILVVHARKLLDARWSHSRLVQLLPIASAVFVAGMGLMVCYQGVQGSFQDQHAHPTKASR